MADYLVRNDGTATGDAGRYTTPQTGSFTALGIANFYPSVASAIAATTPLVNNDRILVSSAHSFLQTATINYTLAAGVKVEIVCVDDSSMENYRAAEGARGREEVISGTGDIILDGYFVIRGMRFRSGDNAVVSAGSGQGIELDDCEFEWVDNFAGGGDGGFFWFKDSNIIGVDNNTLILPSAGGNWNFDSCTFSNLAGNPAGLSVGGFTSGGGSLTIINSDLSAFTNTIISDVGSSAAADDAIHVLIDRCKLADGVVVNNEDMANLGKSITMMRSAFASSDAEYQYYYTALGSQIDSDSGIRRADGQAFEDSGTQISYRVQTGADISTANPFTFEFPISTWAELTGSLDTLRFYVASVAAKDNLQVYFDVSYPDATNKNEMKKSSSANTASWGGVDTMAAGVTLTTDSGSDWRDGVGTFTGNEYLVDVATTTGLDCYPTVTVTVTEASADFYIGSQFDLV